VNKCRSEDHFHSREFLILCHAYAKRKFRQCCVLIIHFKEYESTIFNFPAVISDLKTNIVILFSSLVASLSIIIKATIERKFIKVSEKPKEYVPIWA